MNVNFADFIIAKESEEERHQQYQNLLNIARELDINVTELQLPGEIHRHRLKTNSAPIVASFTDDEQSQILNLLQSVFAPDNDNAHSKMMQIANNFKEKIDRNSRIKFIEARQTVVQADSKASIRHVYAISSVGDLPYQLADGAQGYLRTHENLLYTEKEAKQQEELGGVEWHIDDFTNTDRVKFTNQNQGGNFVSVFSAADNATGSLYLPGQHIPVHPALSFALQRSFLRPYSELPLEKSRQLKQAYLKKLRIDMQQYNPQQARIGQILCTSNTLHRAPYGASLRPGNIRYMVRVTLDNTDKVTMYDMDADELVSNLKLRLRV